MFDLSGVRALISTSVVAAAALVILIGTHALLHDRINANQDKAALLPLLRVFPVDQRAHIALQIAGSLNDANTLGLRGATPFYRAIQDDKLMGWIIPAVARRGYNGDIMLITAIDSDGKIIGAQALDHRETAGIGGRIDRIDNSGAHWLDIFTGHSLRNPSEGRWYVSQDNGNFDAMTGATVTSRAVTQAVRDTLIYFREHRADFIPVDHAPTPVSTAHE